MDSVFKYIEEHQQDYLDELFVFLRQPSISTRDEGVTECAKLLKSMMDNCGIKTEIYETERHPVVFGQIGDNPEAPTVLVYGHYDVQPPEPLELWDSEPFEPEIRDGKIYGRGTSDNKSQLYAHIKGLEAYLKTKGELPINLKYIFEGEEEIGSPNLQPFAFQNKELLKSDVAVFSDSHIHESGRPMLILGLKGMAYVEISLSGANRDLHSMKAAAVPNPVWRMIGLLNSLKDQEGKVLIEGFYDDIRPLLDLEIAEVDKIPYDQKALLQDLDIDHFVKSSHGDHYYKNMIFSPTCNIAGISGGYTGPGSKTVLPSDITVKMDLRLVPDQDPEDIVEKLKKHLVKHGYGDAEIKTHGMIKPSRTPINNKYVPVIKEAVKEAWGEVPLVFPGIGGSGPNYVFTEDLDIPCIVVPFASADQNNHAPNENMIVAGLINGIKSSASIIDKMSKMEDE